LVRAGIRCPGLFSHPAESVREAGADRDAPKRTLEQGLEYRCER